MKAKRVTSVQSIERGLTILEVLSGEAAGLGVAELARRTGLPASTVHRMLAVFVRRGYVHRAGGRCSYRIDPCFLGLGLLPVHLFREIHGLVAERFLARFAAGEVNAVFVTIGSRSLSVRPGRSGSGPGTWLVPEVSEASELGCPWAADDPGPSGCVSMPRGRLGVRTRIGGGEDAGCTCVRIPRRRGEGRIKRTGARWARRAGSADILTVSADLAALGGEMARMMGREWSRRDVEVPR